MLTHGGSERSRDRKGAVYSNCENALEILGRVFILAGLGLAGFAQQKTDIKQDLTPYIGSLQEK